MHSSVPLRPHYPYSQQDSRIDCPSARLHSRKGGHFNRSEIEWAKNGDNLLFVLGGKELEARAECEALERTGRDGARYMERASNSCIEVKFGSINEVKKEDKMRKI